MDPIPVHSHLIAAARTDNAGKIVLEITGDISFDAAAALRNEVFHFLDAHKPKRLVLNLRLVPYMGSGGLSVIVELLRRLPQPQALVLTQVQPNVLAVMKIMKLTTILTVALDDDAALAM